MEEEGKTTKDGFGWDCFSASIQTHRRGVSISRAFDGWPLSNMLTLKLSMSDQDVSDTSSV